MNYYVGLDVSNQTVSICILDEQGQICREAEVPSNPESIHAFLVGCNLPIKKIGLESGTLTHWLTKGLRAEGYEVHPMESRRMAAILATIINKTDKNDARGIAEALRAGHYRQCVHRSDEAMNTRTLLHGRDTLVKQRTQLTNSIRGFIKVYGVKLRKGRGVDYADSVREAMAELADAVKATVDSLLSCLACLDNEIKKLDKLLKEFSKKDQRTTILKTIDGVGDITALAFVSEIDDPERFQNSRNVAAYLGLTPSQYSSGETIKQGKISKRGSSHIRYLLVEAATVMLTRSQAWSPLKKWGTDLMMKKGKKKAITAVARKMAVMMHSMLKSQKPFNRKGKEKRKATNVA